LSGSDTPRMQSVPSFHVACWTVQLARVRRRHLHCRSEGRAITVPVGGQHLEYSESSELSASRPVQYSSTDQHHQHASDAARRTDDNAADVYQEKVLEVLRLRSDTPRTLSDNDRTLCGATFVVTQAAIQPEKPPRPDVRPDGGACPMAVQTPNADPRTLEVRVGHSKTPRRRSYRSSMSLQRDISRTEEFDC
jgi:hypothetical protein